MLARILAICAPPSVTMDETEERAVRGKQARIVRRGLSSTLAGSIIVTNITGFLLWLNLGAEVALAWTAGALAVVMARLSFNLSPRADGVIATAPGRFLALTATGALASGLIWASLPVLIGDPRALDDGAFVIFILAGTSAGAVALGAAHARIALAFAVPMLLSLAASLVFHGGSTFLVFAACVLIFAVLLAKGAKFGESTLISALRLNYEKSRLADSLAEANARAVDAMDRLRHLAHHDGLTDVANRHAFTEELARRIETARAGGDGFAVMLFDVDHFKTVNDTLGHAAGDDLLRTVAARCRAMLGPGDFLARFGGDEFTLLTPMSGGGGAVRHLAGRLVATFAEPVAVAGREIDIGISVGVASYRGEDQSADDLLAAADKALYQAKADGRGCWRAAEPARRDGRGESDRVMRSAAG